MDHPMTEALRDIALRVVAAACLAGCAQAPTKPATATSASSSFDKQKYAAMVAEAGTLIEAGHPTEAIAKDLDPVIAAYDAEYANAKATLYSARTQEEMFTYLLVPMIAGSQPPGVKPMTAAGVSVLDLVWSAALFEKGFALVDLKQLGQAHESMQRAVALSPLNSQYLSELGQLYIYERNWSQAFALFHRAEDAAKYSPPNLKDKELSRAWRGIGYVDIETGQLDEAISLYEKCLALNPDDKMAANELKFAQGRRQPASK
jgi:tetratricopeptide (TPR) repeat protein